MGIFASDLGLTTTLTYIGTKSRKMMKLLLACLAVFCATSALPQPRPKADSGLEKEWSKWVKDIEGIEKKVENDLEKEVKKVENDLGNEVKKEFKKMVDFEEETRTLFEDFIKESKIEDYVKGSKIKEKITKTKLNIGFSYIYLLHF